ncbi:MAG: ribonuclease III [Clostridia bacterium]|nr:ribonuclease III [Clostridia bacterium]
MSGKTEEIVRRYSSAQFAYLGDAVFEVLVRERLVKEGVKSPSVKSLEYVTAAAQSAAADRIEPLLTEEEKNVFRRGRNDVHTGVPKSASPAEYRRATGFESLFGYLFLTEQTKRAAELFDTSFPRETKEEGE